MDGVYYWEDETGWHSEPYDPVEAMLRLNLRGLMPEDIINWLVYAETAEVAEEEENAVAYQVKLGEKYLQGLKAQVQETLTGEAAEESVYTLQGVEKAGVEPRVSLSFERGKSVSLIRRRPRILRRKEAMSSFSRNLPAERPSRRMLMDIDLWGIIW